MWKTSWTDINGRKYMVQLPEGAKESDAPTGIPIGPVDIVDEIGLPEPFATDLHNQFFARKLYTIYDMQRNPNALKAAYQAALNINIQKLMSALHELQQEV